RYRQLEAAIHGLTAHVNGLPRPPNAGSRVEKLALLLIEVTDRLHNLREQIFTAEAELAAALVLADITPAEREILSLRYVAGLSFIEVARRTNRSIGSVFKIHRAALKKAVDGQSADS
ncbi:MAG: hypothetical protein IJP68_01505, partial [Selenomonadaceae bacterium]|nr:hypothetical protein [Selenomonadaceae bacterium]